MSRHKALLITGATGKQGRATIEALLSSPESSDFTILALTRKINSPSAVSLTRKGANVKLVEGDLDNSTAIFDAASKLTPHPIWGVFGVTTPMGGGEERQGKNLVDAALASGVRQFVFSSVERGGLKSSSTPTNIPHFITKHNIEHHLMSESADRGNQMAWTILRPVAFMDNLTPDFPGKLFATAWKLSLGSPGKPLQLISCADIGVVAADVFLKPDEYKNQSLSLASDAITFDQANLVFKRRFGSDMPTTFNSLTRVGLWALKDLGLMFRWFRDEGFGTDVELFRKKYAGMLSFDDWLEHKSAFVKR